MAHVSLPHRSLALAAAAALVVVSCRHRDDIPPQAQPQPPVAPSSTSPYPYQAPQPAPWAPTYAPGSYGPSYPPPLTPAFGFFCATDNDVQCAYGHCIGGRCGGCSDSSQCKRGAACAATPVGGTCWPDTRQSPPPPSAPAQLPPSQPPGTPTQPPGMASDPFAAARQSCVDRINQYRARVGVGPIGRDVSTEGCDDDESQTDARTNTPHGTFGKCGERAQNACPNYPGASVEDVLSKCLQQMFDEGPGGGHYVNMTSTKYSRASCGFVALGGGRVWTVQNFFK